MFDCICIPEKKSVSKKKQNTNPKKLQEKNSLKKHIRNKIDSYEMCTGIEHESSHRDSEKIGNT